MASTLLICSLYLLKYYFVYDFCIPHFVNQSKINSPHFYQIYLILEGIFALKRSTPFLYESDQKSCRMHSRCCRKTQCVQIRGCKKVMPPPSKLSCLYGNILNISMNTHWTFTYTQKKLCIDNGKGINT